MAKLSEIRGELQKDSTTFLDAKSGRKNLLFGLFRVNQRVVSGTVVLAAGEYGHDRFRGGSAGCTYTFSTSNGVTTVTISAGSLEQEVEGLNFDTGNYILSWGGTAQGQIDSGGFGASGVTAALTGGTNTIVEFNTGTLALPQLEAGTVVTPFEHRQFAEELALCQRYYEKSYNVNVSPGTSTNVGAIGYESDDAGSYGHRHSDKFAVSKRVAPTTIVYSQTGASGQIRDLTGASDKPAVVENQGERGFAVVMSPNAAITLGNNLGFHWTADAEL